MKSLLGLLRTQIEERPTRTIFLLWSISLPVAALLSLLVALHWRSESLTVAIDEAEYSLSERVQRVAEMADLKNLSINNFPISLPESDEGSSQMRESQVS